MENNIDTSLEGWADNVTGLYGKLSHYYKDGKSLCGKWVQTHFMRHFDASRLPSRTGMDCTICMRRLEKLKN